VDPLAADAIAAVTQLRPAHRDRADAGLDLALGRVTVADDPAPAMPILKLGVRPEKCLDLGLDDLLQHPPRSRSQHLEQRIVGHARTWARQPNDGILLHGVSSKGDFDHHRGYAACRFIHQICS
jgi:hypothetical protein